MKSILTVIGLALAFVTPAFAGIEWGFPDGTLSVGGTSFGSPGSGNALINAGTYGSGWHGVNNPQSTWSAYGSVPGATGLWDLGGLLNGGGVAGSIVLNNLSGSGLTTLNVFQWVDTSGLGLYNGDLTVTRTSGSATFLGSTLVGSLNTYGAGWYDFTYGLGPALTGTDTVTVTAGAGGAIIDRLTLVPEPGTLIAGAILLIPFALSTIPILRRRKTS